ncbi:hypothetical protein EG346_15475 [Chryseobacterium carnipullorum]|uniref:HNH endonuclease n=1 Tax=Chryseobacterium carnipullorum TaxID=1124835 RepID=A0A3G6M1K4_CHRCU|nr:hypothetical protein [Chryseobacterium carnipullorum]AZA49490.1 hypothetical protein EG346_15475 [Chryseobacterium carnipullorum]
MLYIDNYTGALQYHRKVLSCWLKIKIHGKLKINKICKFCGDSDCESKLTKSYEHTFSLETKSFFTEKIIDDLLSSEPEDLLKINVRYKRDNSFIVDKPFIENLFKVAGYTIFFQKNHGKEFLNNLNRSTCTYCNRNYTLNVSINHASAQMDHWFPKTLFPLLSLSFYNLIPSCSTCNHIKGQSKKKEIWWQKRSLIEMLHPYFPEPNESFKFDFFYKESTKEFTVLFRDMIGKKISKTLDFNLTQQNYQAHAYLELKDLYDLKKKYTENYITFLLDKLKIVEPSDEVHYRLLFGVEKNPNNYHKRPFSKFKNDIIEKLLEIDNKELNL